MFVDVSLRPSPLHQAQKVTLADAEQEVPGGDPWSVPLARVYERAVRSRIGAVENTDAGVVFPNQRTDPWFYSLFTGTALALTDTMRVFDPVATFPSINISSGQALIRPSSPQLLMELLAALPDAVERAPRLTDPTHGDRPIREARRLATSIAALGTETVGRGVEAEPEAANLLRVAAMFLADRSDGIEVEAMCRDIALGITTLQDRADGIIPAREVVLLVRA
ncbi:hypothetical protein AB0L85_32325 [Streptomyces sp. NPDC052051]|uniref:hypothetical protein n=1 Tax=Streptomyces sp. NPDC052051 TaxID=3154649 RepID=UPI00343CC84C